MIESGPAPQVVFTEGGPMLPTPPETTGRFVVVFAEGTQQAGEILHGAASVDVTPAQEFGGAESEVMTSDTLFQELDIAVVSADPEQLGALQTSAAAEGAVLSVSPELVHHVMDSDYVRGYADGVSDLAGRLGVPEKSDMPPAAPGAGPAAPRAPIFRDTPDHTWGVQAVEADVSSRSGQGVAVAVLDTGFDAAHPDFAGRAVTVQSFIPGESPQDAHGHGTHCIGTALGPARPGTGPRYGVAHRADIFAGKVLSNAGSGSDAGILAGIEWAIRSGCSIISMSLGADVPRIHPPYVAAGKRALDKGVLIIAAAGNNAQRLQHNYGFVGAPANSPYILSVGALNQQLDVAFFSARTLVGVRGGQVDLAGPGYQVYSSWPMPTRYRAISGTSMATPHVAGVAALWAESTGFRGRELWATLAEQSTRLIAPCLDVGSGLAVCS